MSLNQIKSMTKSSTPQAGADHPDLALKKRGYMIKYSIWLKEIKSKNHWH